MKPCLHVFNVKNRRCIAILYLRRSFWTKKMQLQVFGATSFSDDEVWMGSSWGKVATYESGGHNRWVKSAKFPCWHWNGLRTVPSPFLWMHFSQNVADWHEDGLLVTMWHGQKLASKKSRIRTEVGQQIHLRMRRTEMQNVMMLQMLGIQMATRFHQTGLGPFLLRNKNKERDTYIWID